MAAAGLRPRAGPQMPVLPNACQPNSQRRLSHTGSGQPGLALCPGLWGCVHVLERLLLVPSADPSLCADWFLGPLQLKVVRRPKSCVCITIQTIIPKKM
ncbi:guanine nucleotide-binding protein G(T) subunit gamma-T1 isoform X2 [Cervus elaphus]|uniref:guanine nucleotide-binding protein G(T) subunit gamma-T1 isoform X2 n=1 Tax=Cervus canadensis TaxID=1574408 RepID=UPI001C9E6AB7|nr:guanine nucleotide-binding protein G(T) subunit gamma-T1 isoform X2 [Cervus canadensis]XP_043728813.1 guanine nucleotide-binding protein G(T) subunit gamma-T1 isoform X2 [Cervus elaphus]